MHLIAPFSEILFIFVHDTATICQHDRGVNHGWPCHGIITESPLKLTDVDTVILCVLFLFHPFSGIRDSLSPCDKRAKWFLMFVANQVGYIVLHPVGKARRATVFVVGCGAFGAHVSSSHFSSQVSREL